MLELPSKSLAILATAYLCTQLVSCRKAEQEQTSQSAPTDYSPYTHIPEAEFVGAKECRSCHEKAFDDWMQSDHHRAMLPATEGSVLGDFDNSTFTHFGRETRFYKNGNEFWVNTEDEKGDRTDYQIEYTFGHYPLQQYLIPFPGGRYQALQVCWDSRSQEDGGQRWYHLYPDEEIPPDDILHWTKRHFNWNFMCADCHSTNLHKNYNLETDTYSTTYSEINVSCEACHGPGSVHIDWANALSSEADADVDLSVVNQYLSSKGLTVKLSEPEPGSWGIDEATGKPKRSKKLASDVQVDTCARCHSHRQLMAPNHVAGSSFHNTHSPSILTDQLYHNDGQVDEEVYVYGSFVQSRMYHSEVRCTDCHHPHTMRTYATGNALCVRCHQADQYDTPAHHFHPVDSTGAQCVECHMPNTNYMVVDARRDHSLRIPRPDLALKTGSPDACTKCHQNQNAEWATEAFYKWWGKGPRNMHYGEILAAARELRPGSLERLIALSTDHQQPGIVRATAIEQLALRTDDNDALQALAAGLVDSDPNVRKTTIGTLRHLPAAHRAVWVAPLLTDPITSVRVEAVVALAGAQSNLTPAQKMDFKQASEDFFTRQQAIADRASGHMALGLFYSDSGDREKAIKAYIDAKRVEPEFIPARINLAELLFLENRQPEAEQEFRAAVEAAVIPENEGQARNALARFLIRMKRHDEGIEEIKKAVELLPEQASIQYFYGVALNSKGDPDGATIYLKKAIDLQPNNLEYLVGAATILRDAGKTKQALQYAQRALALHPENPQLQQLARSLANPPTQ